MIVTPAPTPTATKGVVVRNASTIAMVWQRELIRLRRTPTRILTGLAQPIIFLFILGNGLGQLISTGPAGFDYQEFLFPGIMAMSIITSSLFSAISVVWDREFGFMREMLVAPVSRAAIVFGKALGGGSWLRGWSSYWPRRSSASRSRRSGSSGWWSRCCCWRSR
jgi:ABC-2 type transport system permease protein